MKKSEVILKRWRREILHRIDGRPERGGGSVISKNNTVLFIFICENTPHVSVINNHSNEFGSVA